MAFGCQGKMPSPFDFIPVDMLGINQSTGGINEKAIFRRTGHSDFERGRG